MIFAEWKLSPTLRPFWWCKCSILPLSTCPTQVSCPWLLILKKKLFWILTLQYLNLKSWYGEILIMSFHIKSAIMHPGPNKSKTLTIWMIPLIGQPRSSVWIWFFFFFIIKHGNYFIITGWKIIDLHVKWYFDYWEYWNIVKCVIRNDTKMQMQNIWYLTSTWSISICSWL